MEIKNCEIWLYRYCNECNSQDDVKDLHLGMAGTTLCGDCRKKLIVLLESEGRSND